MMGRLSLTVFLLETEFELHTCSVPPFLSNRVLISALFS